MAAPKVLSAKTLERRRGRIALNRAALDEIQLAGVDGLVELSKSILRGAHVPDATPYGEGLIERGGLVAYVDRKQVANWSVSSADPIVNKPRAAKLGPGSLVVAGFGFPGRFQEIGTVHQPGRPFVSPELARQVPRAGVFIKAAAKRRLARKGSPIR